MSGVDLSVNAERLEAVEHSGGPLLLLAGPGTARLGCLWAGSCTWWGRGGSGPNGFRCRPGGR